jgi:hypothetical protein
VDCPGDSGATITSEENLVTGKKRSAYSVAAVVVLTSIFVTSISNRRSVAAPQNHLEVPRATLSSYSFQLDYEYALRKTLVDPAGDKPYVRLIVMPSQTQEWMVDVTEASVVRLVVADAPVWNNDKPVVRKATTLTANLRPETATFLRQVWLSMLKGVRRPDVARNGLDGTQFHFSAFLVGEGILAGQVWTPEQGTPTERLVRLGELLRKFVEATGTQRSALENQLRNEAETLSARLRK